MQIPAAENRRISEFIQSLDSPVGIDARKTHVYIIHTLHDIQARLDKLEAGLAGIQPPFRPQKVGAVSRRPKRSRPATGASKSARNRTKQA